MDVLLFTPVLTNSEFPTHQQSDMAHLLMKGPSGVYVKEHGSWPGFMASVTLQLFDQQTVL